MSKRTSRRRAPRMPSISAWCTFMRMPTWPCSRPSSTQISQSGPLRLSGDEKRSPARVATSMHAAGCGNADPAHLRAEIEPRRIDPDRPPPAEGCLDQPVAERPEQLAPGVQHRPDVGVDIEVLPVHGRQDCQRPGVHVPFRRLAREHARVEAVQALNHRETQAPSSRRPASRVPSSRVPCWRVLSWPRFASRSSA